jgi:polyisoprenoid-binding protein YceI
MTRDAMKTLTTRRIAVAALAALMFGARAAPAQPPVAQLLRSASAIDFTTHQMGVPVQGTFGSFSAAIALDPKHASAGSVSVTIDTGSARFGAPELDAEVGKPQWLASARFPRATFRSSAIRSIGGGRFEVTGRLTIKGRSHEIVVPVLLTQSAETTVASGRFTIKRLAFAVGEGEWTDTSMLGNDVEVSFKLALGGVPPL